MEEGLVNPHMLTDYNATVRPKDISQENKERSKTEIERKAERTPRSKVRKNDYVFPGFLSGYSLQDPGNREMQRSKNGG